MTCQEDEPEWEAEFEEFQHDEPEMLPCPFCSAQVYEETQRCPHCGNWIMPLAASTRSRSKLWIIAAILALIAIIVFIIR